MYTVYALKVRRPPFEGVRVHIVCVWLLRTNRRPTVGLRYDDWGDTRSLGQFIRE